MLWCIWYLEWYTWNLRWCILGWCIQEFTNLRQYINQQHMHGDRPPLLTFNVGKIPACLTCSPALHFLENQMFRCKIWNKGVFARKSGSAKRLRGGGGEGGALADAVWEERNLHGGAGVPLVCCWCTAAGVLCTGAGVAVDLFYCQVGVLQ